MIIKQEKIQELNKIDLENHNDSFDFLINQLQKNGLDYKSILKKIEQFQVAIPSWALGAGGTRFGRFSIGGEPSNLDQKIEDIGLLHALTKSAGAVSLHIPWDIPSDISAIKEKAQSLDIQFDAVNSNTFQDPENNKHSYKNGSLSNINKSIREQAIQHNIEVIKLGDQLGSKALTVWLADGSNFPGQSNFQNALDFTAESLKRIYNELPSDWKILIEYKPYEPNFYSTVIQDWGTSLLLANECGEKAYSLVDLGHHLPNTNIEQIVATLMYKEKLGGFHFNDSKYGDDDLTVGSIKPYSLFLIFNELVWGIENNSNKSDLAWMIDASHNIKDPLEDLIQSIDAILETYAKALLIDQNELKAAQKNNDVVLCQEILQNAFKTDVRPLIEKARINQGASLYPLKTFRKLKVRENLITTRGEDSKASGL